MKGDATGERGRPTRAVVDLEAVAQNLGEVRRLAPGHGVIAVVKADAYGHGAQAVAQSLASAGCEALAVLSVDEAAALRDAGVGGPILVLGGVHDAPEAARAAELSLVPVVHRSEQLGLLAEAGRGRDAPIPFEVEVDTGMRRMGAAAEAVPDLLAHARTEPTLAAAGLFTHLACADDPDPASSREQLARFGALLAGLSPSGLLPPRIHVANSAGVLQAPDLAGAVPPEVNFVRPGLMLYGVCPAPHQADRVSLHAAMTLQTEVVAVHAVRAGDPVGYGATHRAAEPGVVATAAAGYADGVPWSLGGCGEALLGGRRVPYAGRVSMDYVGLASGSGPARVGDEVVVFGRAADGARLPVEDLAARARTLAYELLVRVGARVPRTYLAADPPATMRP